MERRHHGKFYLITTLNCSHLVVNFLLLLLFLVVNVFLLLFHIALHTVSMVILTAMDPYLWCTLKSSGAFKEYPCLDPTPRDSELAGLGIRSFKGVR